MTRQRRMSEHTIVSRLEVAIAYGDDVTIVLEDEPSIAGRPEQLRQAERLTVVLALGGTMAGLREVIDLARVRRVEVQP